MATSMYCFIEPGLKRKQSARSISRQVLSLGQGKPSILCSVKDVETLFQLADIRLYKHQIFFHGCNQHPKKTLASNELS